MFLPRCTAMRRRAPRQPARCPHLEQSPGLTQRSWLGLAVVEEPLWAPRGSLWRFDLHNWRKSPVSLQFREVQLVLKCSEVFWWRAGVPTVCTYQQRVGSGWAGVGRWPASTEFHPWGEGWSRAFVIHLIMKYGVAEIFKNQIFEHVDQLDFRLWVSSLPDQAHVRVFHVPIAEY